MVLGREAGLTLYGGPYLNLTDPVALAEAERMGLSAAVLSPEGKIGQLAALSRRSGIPTGLYAYGHMALMAVRNCPVRAQIGCRACGRKGYLLDRKQVQFPVRCDPAENILSPDNAVSYLLNSLPLSMTDKQESLRDFDFALLDFTIETAAEVAKVLRHWQEKTALPEYTRGLYNRGVI
jgi:putative protease